MPSITDSFNWTGIGDDSNGTVDWNAIPNGDPYDGGRIGIDFAFATEPLQGQTADLEKQILAIQEANLSDTEKMFSMQMAMNSWSAVTNLRTNMIKSVSDSLKTISRNVA